MRPSAPLLTTLILVLLGSVACGTPSSTAQTPEAATERLVRQQTPTGTPQGFTAVQTRMYDQFAVVFYTRANHDPAHELFYQLVHRDTDTWYTKECCDGGGGSLTTTEELTPWLRFSIGSSADPRFVFGHVLSPDVATVEAIFADQQTIRAPVNDTLFLVMSKTSRNICMLQALSKTDTVLGQSHLSTAEGCNVQ